MKGGIEECCQWIRDGFRIWGSFEMICVCAEGSDGPLKSVWCGSQVCRRGFVVQFRQGGWFSWVRGRCFGLVLGLGSGLGGLG